MRTVIQVHDLISGALCLTKPTPSLGDKRTNAGGLDSVKNKLRHLIRFVDDNAAKADIYRGRSPAQETIKFIGGVVPRWVPEEKATDILDWQAALASAVMFDRKKRQKTAQTKA